MRRAALVIAALALLTGCTTVTPGRAGVAPALAVGTRPRELRLDGRDPCSLLTSAQAMALGLNDTSRHQIEAGVPVPGLGCGFLGSTPKIVIAEVVFGNNTDLADLSRPGGLSDDLTPIKIGRFPALLARPSNTHVCFVDVDVASGQVLDVEFGDGGENPPIAQDQLCQDATNLASGAMKSLQTS